MALFHYFAWRYFVFSRGVFSLFRLFAWRFFVFLLCVLAGRKDEITQAKRRNNEKTPCEKTKNKSLKWRYFAWRFFVFSRSFFVISRGAFRFFVFSPGVISSFRLAFFRYFVFSLGVISSWRRAITPGEKTKERNNEMAQTSHHT